MVKNDEKAMTDAIIQLATRYGRYGCQRITGLLRNDSWRVKHKRVEQIWRQEGLKGPKKQPKRGRLWLNEGSCIRLRLRYRNEVWTYDFVMDRTHDSREIRLLTIIDKNTRDCLTIKVDRKLKSEDVVIVLADLFILKGVPDHVRSDNG
jgi:putative transposase